jgi:hypothetical protein
VKYRRMGTTGVERCLEVGVNHFDCADVYGAGRAEEVLGRCIADVRDEHRSRHEGRVPSRARGERPGGFRSPSPKRHRGQPGAARHRPDRSPVPPPVRLARRSRRLTESPRSSGRRRQGAVHRRLGLRGLAGRHRPRPQRPPRLVGGHRDPAHVQPRQTPGRGRVPPPRRERRPGRTSVTVRWPAGSSPASRATIPRR